MIKSYRSPKTEVRPSSIDRQGRFAKELIKKGEIVVIRAGHIINKEELEEQKDIIRDADMQISDDLYLAPLSEEEFNNVMCFVNHSCNPNLGFRGDITVIAIRDIKQGEELCLDYAMYDNNNQRFECNCKQANCRKTITGKDWMKKDLQKKYGNYFSSHLLEKIKGNNK